MVDPDPELLAHLWDEHVRAEFPAALRGCVIQGEDLVFLDASVAGCVSSAVAGRLDERRREILRECIERLETVLPLIDDQYGGEYYARLRDLAVLADGGREGAEGVHPIG